MNLPLSLSTPPRPPQENRRPYFAVYLLLASLTAVVYAPLRHAGFADTTVVDNALHLQGTLWDGLPWMITGGAGSPLGWVSHWMDLHLHGLDPTGHHLTSLAFHLLNTILLFGLLWRVFSSLLPAAIGAGLFAVHPVNLDAVAWIAGRRYLLSLFFWLILMRGYISWGVEKRSRAYLCMAASAVLGSLSDPLVFIAAPAVLLFFDFWPLKRWREGVKGPKNAGSFLFARIREKAALWAICAVLPVVLWAVGSPGAGGPAAAGGGMTAVAATLTAPAVLFSAFFHLPNPAPLAASAPPALQAGVALLLLCAMSAAVAAAGRRCPALLPGWVWFLTTALVEAVPIASCAGQTLRPWAYLPAAGLALLAAAVFSAAGGVAKKRGIAVAALGIGVVLLVAYGAAAKLERWRRSCSPDPAVSCYLALDREVSEDADSVWNGRGSMPSALIPRTKKRSSLRKLKNTVTKAKEASTISSLFP